MRTTNYYGLNYAARSIELRRGTVNRVETGVVYWYNEEQKALNGGALCRINYTGQIYTGTVAKVISEELDNVRRVIHKEMNDPLRQDRRGDYDRVISRHRTAANPYGDPT